MLITKTAMKYNIQKSNSGAVFGAMRRIKFYMPVKRLFDITVSLVLIIAVLSWLTPVVALLILLDSKSPVFFRQRRVGRFGKTFTCFKFRTMYNNIEADFKQASDDDPRITRLGHFLRKTNIDELPQLINVLMGDMSIIGPRPHMLKDCKDFNEVVKNYKLRSFVKPGITGLAQIKGFRGPTTDDLSVIHRFRWDLFYIRHRSLAFDISILFTTIYQAGAHFISNIAALFNKRGKTVQNVEFENKKQIAA